MACLYRECSIFRDAFESNMGVGVLRNASFGLDYSELVKRHNVGEATHLNLPNVEQHLKSDEAFVNFFVSLVLRG